MLSLSNLLKRILPGRKASGKAGDTQTTLMSDRARHERTGLGQGSRYTQNLKKPRRFYVSDAAGKTILQIVLLIVLPPVGLLWLWRRTSYPRRGQFILSILALCSMTVMFTLYFNASVPDPIAPVPQAANVLSASEPTPEPTPEPPPTTQQPTPEPDPTQEPEPVYVYAVRTNATQYHAGKKCEKQSNRRKLLLEDALAEGLEPCPKCNPPLPGAQAQTDG